MITSGFTKLKSVLLGGAVLAVASGFTYGSYHLDKLSAIEWGSRCFYQNFDHLAEAKLKGWDFKLTDDAFLRFRKTYATGKQEYYSFNLRRFKDMDYLGNVSRGVLRIHTKADDVIVQTFNDPKGNVDSMSTTMKIPLRDMSAERVDSLFNTLLYLKNAR